MKSNVQSEDFPRLAEGIHLVLSIVMLFSMGACAVNKSVPLDQGFWDDNKPVVGVVLVSVPDPEVTVKISSTTPFGRQKTMVMSRRYDQDFDEEPSVLRDQRRLWHYLNSHEIKAFAGLKDIFAQGLDARGFRVVAIDEYIDLNLLPRFTPPASTHARKDYRGMSQAKGLDLLIVLNVQKYGTYCGYLDQRNISTGVTAAITGEMVDMRTNRLLWRRAHRAGWDCESASSGCDEPETYPQILKELGNALSEAAAGAADDFFSGAPQ